MTLSQQVEYSLREAQESLRNALAFAARNEKPYISKHIADMLANIDSRKMLTYILSGACGEYLTKEDKITRIKLLVKHITNEDVKIHDNTTIINSHSLIINNNSSNFPTNNNTNNFKRIDNTTNNINMIQEKILTTTNKESKQALKIAEQTGLKYNNTTTMIDKTNKKAIKTTKEVGEARMDTSEASKKAQQAVDIADSISSIYTKQGQKLETTTKEGVTIRVVNENNGVLPNIISDTTANSEEIAMLHQSENIIEILKTTNKASEANKQAQQALKIAEQTELKYNNTTIMLDKTNETAIKTTKEVSEARIDASEAKMDASEANKKAQQAIDITDSISSIYTKQGQELEKTTKEVTSLKTIMTNLFTEKMTNIGGKIQAITASKEGATIKVVNENDGVLPNIISDTTANSEEIAMLHQKIDVLENYITKLETKIDTKNSCCNIS